MVTALPDPFLTPASFLPVRWSKVAERKCSAQQARQAQRAAAIKRRRSCKSVFYLVVRVFASALNSQTVLQTFLQCIS